MDTQPNVHTHAHTYIHVRHQQKRQPRGPPGKRPPRALLRRRRKRARGTRSSAAAASGGPGENDDVSPRRALHAQILQAEAELRGQRRRRHPSSPATRWQQRVDLLHRHVRDALHRAQAASAAAWSTKFFRVCRKPVLHFSTIKNMSYKPYSSR